MTWIWTHADGPHSSLKGVSLSAEDLRVYRELFREFDADGGGSMDAEKVEEKTKTEEMAMVLGKLSSLVDTFDKLKDGCIQAVKSRRRQDPVADPTAIEVDRDEIEKRIDWTRAECLVRALRNRVGYRDS